MPKNILINNKRVFYNYNPLMPIKNLFKCTSEEKIPIDVRFNMLPQIGETTSLLDIFTTFENLPDEESDMMLIGYAFSESGTYALLMSPFGEDYQWYVLSNQLTISDRVVSYIDYENPIQNSQFGEDYYFYIISSNGENRDRIYMFVGLTSLSNSTIGVILGNWPSWLSTYQEK